MIVAISSRIAVLLPIWLFGMAAWADAGTGTGPRLEVQANAGEYQVLAVMHSGFDRALLWSLIDDFSLLPQLNPAVKQVTPLPSPDPAQRRMLLRTRACVWFFCKSLTHLQTVVHTGETAVIAVIDPNRSDYKAGWAQWVLEQTDGGGSTLTIQVVLTPDFWVPPIIGPFLIKRKLQQEVLESLANLERLAARMEDHAREILRR